MIGYQFVRKKEWMRKGVFFILFVSIITFFNVLSFVKFGIGDLTKLSSTIIYFILVIVGVYRAIYYFTIHKKDYIIIDDRSLSKYRGNLIPRKQIPFSQVERVVQVNNLLVFILGEGKEEQIDTDLLSSKNKIELIKIVKSNFAQKTVGF